MEKLLNTVIYLSIILIIMAMYSISNKSPQVIIGSIGICVFSYSLGSSSSKKNQNNKDQ